VSDIGESYDRAAERYRDHWGPVIAETGLRLLDRLAPALDGRTDASLVDVGTGLGLLALVAAERWPTLRLTGIDPSRGMLAIARERVAQGDRQRSSFIEGEAERIPLPDASADIITSAFALQLVSDRSAALREMRRVLRPKGWFGAVTWIDDVADFEPLAIFDDLADEWELPEDATDHETLPFASVTSAADEVRDAGFADVDARPDAVVHRFTPKSYLGLLENWERDDVFGALEPDELREVRAETLRRWAGLAPDAFVWRAPVVSVVARKASR
jgi:ubiquinone/menaquinone biosynthesis C-methylase UbiE